MATSRQKNSRTAKLPPHALFLDKSVVQVVRSYHPAYILCEARQERRAPRTRHIVLATERASLVFNQKTIALHAVEVFSRHAGPAVRRTGISTVCGYTQRNERRASGYREPGTAPGRSAQHLLAGPESLPSIRFSFIDPNAHLSNIGKLMNRH